MLRKRPLIIPLKGEAHTHNFSVNNPQIYQIVQDRFQTEAAILEELGETNHQIPRLYAYFTENGKFYLVQEWL
ncbi:MAG: hypothetical protein F6K24_21910 [Okeania sp. SIO2D1]|nr:hypothetical protein [Okeania sp. SIO2C9]NES67705.1 hypothetical protein [Okeania sp. SIO2D1]